jgi:hypothetical protein
MGWFWAFVDILGELCGRAKLILMLSNVINELLYTLPFLIKVIG